MEQQKPDSWMEEPKQNYWQFLASRPSTMAWQAIGLVIAIAIIITMINDWKGIISDSPLWALILACLILLGFIGGIFAQPYTEYKNSQKP